jgi:hypothetical protein
LVRAVELTRAYKRGQEHAETRPTAQPLSNLDPPAVGQHNGLTDGQPEPVARNIQLLCGLLAEERLEYARAILHRDARALVINRQLQFGIVREPRRDANCGPRRRVFDRVLDQIAEHTLHVAGVHVYCWEGRWHV